MGIYDRDYLRDEPAGGFYRGPRAAGWRGGVGSVRMWSITTWLIVINCVVFVLDLVITAQVGVVDPFGNVGSMTIHPLKQLGEFSVTMAIFHLQLWRLITFQFLHSGAEHILFNMIGLYFFGPMIEDYLGSKRYLAFYLLCGVAGPIFYVALWAMGFLAQGASTPLVGASAGIFGVLIAAAQVAPDSTVLVYGILPMRLRTMAWVLLAIAAYAVFFGGPRSNAGGQAAHLGGAAAGYLLINNQRWLNVFDFRRRP
jgi:membrane associated rhomboid family serine protease